VNVGVGSNVKFEALVSVMPLTVSVITPVVAPAGTDVVNFLPLATEAVTIAGTPLNSTI
jgi:hypothetical protein